MTIKVYTFFMSGSSRNYVYLTKKNFYKFFLNNASQKHYDLLSQNFKEGDLFKIPVNNKVFHILSVESMRMSITIDEAFIMLMSKGDILEKEQKKLKQATKTYNQASAIEKEGNFEQAEHLFFVTITICSDIGLSNEKIIHSKDKLQLLFDVNNHMFLKPYFRKIKGNAFFHLGCMAFLNGKKMDSHTYFKETVKLYPEHSKANLFLQSVSLDDFYDQAVQRYLFLKEKKQYENAKDLLCRLKADIENDFRLKYVEDELSFILSKIKK